MIMVQKENLFIELRTDNYTKEYKAEVEKLINLIKKRKEILAVEI